jgi:GNAT superfamily N-acetyltransferase
MVNRKLSICVGAVDEGIEVIKEAAKWLIDIEKPMWKLEDITKEKLLKDNRENDFYVLKVDDEVAGAMILKWNDPFFWPDIKQGKSGFVHKLSVRRKYSGTGISEKMLEYAADECRRKNIDFLRLDCDGNRKELCSFYEKFGFKQVRRKMMGVFDVVFYELNVNSKEHI